MLFAYIHFFQTIHASKYQKQRMKSLERFSSSENGLLLATDVAARGLDLPEVKYVIHYEVPKTFKVCQMNFSMT